MVKGKEVTSVKDMIRAIEAGDRELKTKECSPESLPNRFDEMYEMITLLEMNESTAGDRVTDAGVLSAQALDPYCQQMKQLLQGKETRTGKEEMCQLCK